jgi:hypothetical protein
MKHRSVISLLVAVLPCAGLASFAFDWEAMSRSPAQIEVVDMQPGPLVENNDRNGWAKVPAALTKYGAVIYLPPGKYDGLAQIKVTGDGYLLVACNYDYQGNKSGNWGGEVWDAKKFQSKGWHAMSKRELDGELVKGNGRAQVVFSKQVHKGEVLHLRCNKYDPPYPILLGGKHET